MEARDLGYFAVVAEHGNLRRAAEALNLSQPALSKSLRRLERSAGTKLVKRTSKGVALTTVGTSLLAHARRLRLCFDEMGRELSDLNQGHAGHLRIGAALVQVEHLVSPACTQLLKDAPKATVEITVGSNDVLLPALLRGELDVVVCGISAAQHDELVQERLHEDEFVVYASARHRLTTKKRVTISDLSRERWALTPTGTIARRMLQGIFEENASGPPQVVMQTASIHPKIQLVASSDVLGFTPWRDVREFAVRYRLVKLEVPGLRATRIVGLSYRKDAYQSPALQRLIEIVKLEASEKTINNRSAPR